MSNELPTMTKKASDILNTLVQLDPSVFNRHNKNDAFAVIEKNLKHVSISLRESAIDLVGTYLKKEPALVPQYFQILMECAHLIQYQIRTRSEEDKE